MIVLLSPAKTLDDTPTEVSTATTPRLLSQSCKLVKILREYSSTELQNLMGISEKLAVLNSQRYKSFCTPFDATNAKTAISTFKGDVYLGLEAEQLDAQDFLFAQRHLRILSGLYGLLRPLDLIQPYRLEMGTRLSQNGSKNLYEFWEEQISQLLKKDLEESGSNIILNLASQEYFRAIQLKEFKNQSINIHFKELRGDVYKVISFNAKKARGRMAHLLIKERITNPEDLKELVINDYAFNPDLTKGRDWVFSQ